MKKIMIILLLVFAVVLITLEVISRHVIPYALIQPGRTHENIQPSDFDLESKNLTLLTSDSLNIKGYWIQSKSKPKAIIIFVHGIGSCKEHFLGLAKEMSDLGFESILFDLRAHGESEGKFITYGYYEKFDVKKIVDHIKSVDDSINIGIWGNSLGGAVALQSMAEDDRIDFGIIESTFRDLEEIMIDYQRRIINIPLGYYMQKAMKKAEEIAHFKINGVKPLKSVKKIKNPVLIAHGSHDKNISFEYGKELFDNLGSQEKEWVLVENGEHDGLGETGGKDYFNKVLSFIQKHSKDKVKTP